MKQEEIHPGDYIKVYHQITESGKKRTQVFDGVVISVKGREEKKTFTVRKITKSGIAVERIWPLYSPVIKQIKIVKKTTVRRAKLYYLRQLIGKKARIFQ